MNGRVPEIDQDARRRLTARFGAGAHAWLDGLPPVLAELAGRWQVDLGALVPRGSMSVVIRCRTRAGRPAVLKISPDRRRLAVEASALATWTTPHTPAVLAVDHRLGALLLEAVTPGIPLAESLVEPDPDVVARLVIGLHTSGVPDPSYPLLADRVRHLFDAGTTPYARSPRLAEVVPPALYERGRQLAERLVRPVAPTALLHGDLTPANVLDGGAGRGLVAVDPAPCLGDDPAFDAVDLVLWRAGDVGTIEARAGRIAAAIGTDPGRLLDWCTAFAAMVALELAETPGADVRPVLALAGRA